MAGSSASMKSFFCFFLQSHNIVLIPDTETVAAPSHRLYLWCVQMHKLPIELVSCRKSQSVVLTWGNQVQWSRGRQLHTDRYNIQTQTQLGRLLSKKNLSAISKSTACLCSNNSQWRLGRLAKLLRCKAEYLVGSMQASPEGMALEFHPQAQVGPLHMCKRVCVKDPPPRLLSCTPLSLPLRQISPIQSVYLCGETPALSKVPS